MPSSAPQPPTPSLARLWHRPAFWLAIAGAILEIGLLAGTRIPLGIPGEWTWQRLPGGDYSVGLWLLSAIWVLPAGAFYLAVCHFGYADISKRSLPGRSAWLVLLAVASLVWLWCLIDANRDSLHRLGRGPIVHYYDAFSGYFHDARRPDDFAGALANYERKMSQGNVLHIGTHPPGLMIAHRGLLNLFRASPGLTNLVLATRPDSVRAAEIQVIAVYPLPGGGPVNEADFAALWTATLIVMIAAALAILPLYSVVSTGAGTRVGWQVACFWPLVPALAIFIPKADALLPLLGMLVVAAWWPSNRRTRLGVAVAAVVFWLGMLVSLAVLAVGCLLFLLTIGEIARAEPAERREILTRTTRDLLLAGAVFGGCTLLFWFVTDVNLINVWRWNYHNHSAFYDQYERTYWKWLIVNPIELTLAAGLPVIGAGLGGVWRGSRRAWLRFAKPCHPQVSQPQTIHVPVLAILGTVGLLWISGKNSGEAARLWLFLMPWLLWCTAGMWTRENNRGLWFAILVLQMLTAFVVSCSISGFEFQRFMAKS